MARLPRVVVFGCWHHVTQRGNFQQTVFFDVTERRQYMQLLKYHCERHDVRIAGYCLMGNHVHLLMIPAAESGLARTLAGAQQKYGVRGVVARAERARVAVSDGQGFNESACPNPNLNITVTPGIRESKTSDTVWNHTPHQRWLSMKEAYNRYINASASLDEFMEETGDVQARLLHEQRLAYEGYIEARLQFSESLLPRFGADSENRALNLAASQGWTRMMTSKLRMPALGIALVCITAAGLSYLFYGRQVPVTDNATVNPIPDDRLIPTPIAANPAPQVPIQSDGSMSFPADGPVRPAAPRPIHATAPVAGHRWRHVQVAVPQAQKSITYAQPVKVQRNGKRAYYEFTLKSVPGVERVGPIQASLRRIDWKHGNFDLSVRHGNLWIEEKHLRLYEPRIIRLSGQAKPVQLLTDRIGQNYVHGYLCDSQCNVRELMPRPIQFAGAWFGSRQNRRF